MQNVWMTVDVIRLRRMKLHHAFFLRPKQVFDVAHFQPVGSALVFYSHAFGTGLLECLGLVCSNADMFPPARGAVVGDDCKRRAARTGNDVDTGWIAGLVARHTVGDVPVPFQFRIKSHLLSFPAVRIRLFFLADAALISPCSGSGASRRLLPA